MLKFDLKVLG